MDSSSGSDQGPAYGRARGRSRGRLRSVAPTPPSSMFGQQSPMPPSPSPSMFGQPSPMPPSPSPSTFGQQAPMPVRPALSMLGQPQTSTMPPSLPSSMYGQLQSSTPSQMAMYGAMVSQPPPSQMARLEQLPSPAPSILSEISSLTTSIGEISFRDAVAEMEREQFENVTTMSAATLNAAISAGRGARRGRRDELAVLATRPKHMTDKTGLSGNPIKLVANYFRLLSLPQWCVHQYHVDFLPLVESSRIRRALINDHREQFGRCFVFDGMSDLKTPTRLPHEITELYSKRRTDGAPITIRIKWVQELAPTNPDLLRLFNTQMRRNLEHLDFVQINRHFFDKRAVSAIPQHGLELWQGLITAIGQYETGVMMVTDTVHKVLRRDSVLDLLSQVSSSGPHYRDEAMKRVAGCIVMTPYNNKTYRVDDIDWDKSPASVFETKEGPKTYMQYYADQYEKCIRDARQPLLVCRPKEKDLRAGRTENIYLVPELCVLTGLTDEMRANVSVMRDLAQHTRIDPPKRVRNLLEFIQRINGNEAIRHEMELWGLTFDNALVSIDGRTLPPEKVMQSGQVYRYSPATADFSREMRDKRLHVAVAIDSWLVVCPKREEANVTEFVRNLMSVCPPMGVRMGQPQMLQLDDDRAGNYVRALHELGGGGNLQLALIVVPNNRKDRYDMIKKQACVDLGLHTQVILARTIGNRKNVRSVATKVAIQLNCKLGGEAWCLEIPLSNTMVIGYDTYHDAGSRNRSAGAFVASMNRTFTRWYSRVSFHASHQELGSTLALHLQDALRKYAQVNDGASPERIIFFRDGVSDGQIPQVREWEIDQIVSSLDVLFPGVEHKLAFVVVTKRISTRFFAHTTSGGFNNPPPGTVVDTEVTRPERYDFFLVSQSVRQGTVAPTHYNVIYDTTGLKPDHMQRLSYKLTHLYFNWPGTIRVPAPCQYAHKLAFLAGQSLHGEHSPRLASTLFYL
ncbi:piwi-like protein 1 [Dermacentor andersoni]|uniref:piwi-like protein 1 n=1 Tax=Dermacentor andersoni TaxID=34620 RepID=UPI0021556A47|nr:piwi-like protein 1 [Dermacentor andersoni]XP_054920142.1 piwi-like protein 1 [Dermacentor andersoni]